MRLTDNASHNVLRFASTFKHTIQDPIAPDQKKHPVTLNHDNHFHKNLSSMRVLLFQDLVNASSYLFKIFFFFTPSSFCCRSKANTGGIHRGTSVERDGVFVNNNPCFFKTVPRLFAGNSSSTLSILFPFHPCIHKDKV